ncbi:hypothetical protein D3C76_1489100 [compost metagenome]
MTGNDFQCAFAAGNDQRRSTEHGARLLVMLRVQHASTPDNQFTLAEIAEGARIRFGHCADQVVDFLRRFMPQDLTVCRSPAAKVAGFGFVLRTECRRAVFQLRQFVLQQ